MNPENTNGWVRTQQDGAVLTVTLDRPDQLNAQTPTTWSTLARIGSSLRDMDQWKKNATQARTMLSAEDVALTSMRELLQQARQIATSVSQLSAVDPMR